MKQGFNYDSQGDIYYQGKYYYSLLEGKTRNNYTSDIIFIYKEPIFIDDKKIIQGKVIDFVYGGFDNLAYDYIEEKIKEYEKEN